MAIRDDSTATRLALGRRIYDYFVAQGLSPHQAAAMAGGMAWESDGRADAFNPGDNPRYTAAPHSMGVAQWNGPRALALVDFARRQGIDIPTGNLADPRYARGVIGRIPLETQLAFAWRELQGPEGRAMAGLRGAQDVRTAAAGAIGYHRPAGFTWGNPAGGHGFGNRLSLAEAILAGGAGNTPGDRTPPPSTTVAAAPPPPRADRNPPPPPLAPPPIPDLTPQPDAGGFAGAGRSLLGLAGLGAPPPRANADAAESLDRQRTALSQTIARLMRGTFRDGGHVTAAALRIAARDTNTSPTDKQKEAGNYAKGRVRFAGMDIAIENPKGSTRSGVGKDGKPWRCRLPAHYGYFSRTEGKDGDQVDCYIGDKPDNETVWIVDQVDAKTRRFDEHKALLGFPTREAAVKAYTDAFSDGKGKDRIGAVTEMGVERFKAWLKNGDTTKPLGMRNKYADGGSVGWRGDMPLLRGKKNVGRNIGELMDTGRPHKQAVAIALKYARQGRAGYQDGGAPENWEAQGLSLGERRFDIPPPPDLMPDAPPTLGPPPLTLGDRRFRVEPPDTTPAAVGALIPQTREERENAERFGRAILTGLEISGAPSARRSLEALREGRPIAAALHGGLAAFPYSRLAGLGLVGSATGTAAGLDFANMLGDILSPNPLSSAAAQSRTKNQPPPADLDAINENTGLTLRETRRLEQIGRLLRNEDDPLIRRGLEEERREINAKSERYTTARQAIGLNAQAAAATANQEERNRQVRLAEAEAARERGRQRRFGDTWMGREIYDPLGGHGAGAVAALAAAIGRLPFPIRGQSGMVNYGLPIIEGVPFGFAAAHLPTAYEAYWSPSANPEWMAAEAMVRYLPENHPDRPRWEAIARRLGSTGPEGQRANPVQSEALKNLKDPALFTDRSLIGAVEGLGGGLLGANLVRGVGRLGLAANEALRRGPRGPAPGGPGLPSPPTTGGPPPPIDITPPPPLPGPPPAVARLGDATRRPPPPVEPTPPPRPGAPIPPPHLGGPEHASGVTRYRNPATNEERFLDARGRWQNQDGWAREPGATWERIRRDGGRVPAFIAYGAAAPQQKGSARSISPALCLAREYANGGMVVGPVVGTTDGRADAKPVDVEGGSFVVPADVVAACGNGNTLAGHKVLERVFGPPTRARGGPVPIRISDGEHVLTRDQVAKVGGGDHDKGCKILDAWVVDTRKKNIKHLQKLPPPAKS